MTHLRRVREEREAGVAGQLVVHVAADAHRQVDPLRLEARDLAAEEVHGAGSSARGVPSSWSSPS